MWWSGGEGGEELGKSSEVWLKGPAEPATGELVPASTLPKPNLFSVQLQIQARPADTQLSDLSKPELSSDRDSLPSSYNCPKPFYQACDTKLFNTSRQLSLVRVNYVS